MAYTSNTIPINPRVLDDLETHVRILSTSLEAALTNLNAVYAQATNTTTALMNVQHNAANKFANELNEIESSLRALVKSYQVVDREMSQLPGVQKRLDDIKALLTTLEQTI